MEIGKTCCQLSAADMGLTETGLPMSEEKIESSEHCQLLCQLPHGAWFKQPASERVALLMGDAALQSNLSKTMTKEF